VRLYQPKEWNEKLASYGCSPCNSDAPKLETAAMWKSKCGFVFTVPIEASGQCDQYSLDRVLLELQKLGCAPLNN
jgi:hypothetical protein